MLTAYELGEEAVRGELLVLLQLFSCGLVVMWLGVKNETGQGGRGREEGREREKVYVSLSPSSKSSVMVVKLIFCLLMQAALLASPLQATI